MRFLFIFCFLTTTCIFLLSQDIEYARSVIKKMSSPEFHGRGYTNNGDKIAAEYLKNELERLNIKSFNEGYFQYFNLDVNTLPSKIKLKLNDLELKPGVDYIVHNSSSGCKGKYKVVKVDSTISDKLLSGNFTDKFIVLDANDFKSKDSKQLYMMLKMLNIAKAKGIIDLTEGKPTQIVKQEADNFVRVILSKEKFNSSINEISISFKNKFIKDYQTQNVYGFIEGEVDTFIMFGAHYDHLGDMGKKTFFPGANDNASGCAMLLNLADYYSKNKPYYSYIFSFFSAEEIGILGSKYMSENPPVSLDKIKFFFNLDLLGTGEEGIKLVNGTLFNKEYDLLNQINDEKKYLVKIGKRGAAMNSDHYYFYKKDVPAFFIYTMGGYSEYHNVYDIEETLKLTEFEDLFKLIRDFLTIYR